VVREHARVLAHVCVGVAQCMLIVLSVDLCGLFNACVKILLSIVRVGVVQCVTGVLSVAYV